MNLGKRAIKVSSFMKTLIFFFLLGFCTSETKSQSSYIVGTKSYKTTDTFKLYEIKNNALSGKIRTHPVNFTMGIDGEKGVIIISKQTFSTQERFSGELHIYLDDNSVIKCLDRGYNDVASNIMSKVYFLTEQELGMLLNSNINGVRYSTRFMQANPENFIVYNSDFEEWRGNFLEPEFKARINFPVELKKLYDFLH